MITIEFCLVCSPFEFVVSSAFELYQTNLAKLLKLLSDLVSDVLILRVKSAKFSRVSIHFGEGEAFRELPDDVVNIQSPAASRKFNLAEGCKCGPFFLDASLECIREEQDKKRDCSGGGRLLV